MAALTLEQLKAVLEDLQMRASTFDTISSLRAMQLITDVEEAQLKTRLRAQLRAMIDAIPKDTG